MFLSWLRDRAAPVFVVATANDVTRLPLEMLRKGRFAELFFVDLPNQKGRDAIWRIQVAKVGRKTEQFPVPFKAIILLGVLGVDQSMGRDAAGSMNTKPTRTWTFSCQCSTFDVPLIMLLFLAATVARVR